MAKMIDQLPEYIGEQMVWHAFSDNLPNHYIVYNSRTIQGDEYDFCILVENMGIFIVEVFTDFPESFDHYYDVLKNAYQDAVVAFGDSIEEEERERNIYRFQTDPECTILLCDKSGGEGRNLQNADYLIHIDLPWDINRLEQRIGRLDRLGRNVTIPVTSVVVHSNDSYVDHFIPWSFVKDDRIWNFVLACPRCNLKKHDNLPPRNLILKIEHQNTLVERAKEPLIQNDFESYSDDLIPRIWTYAKISGYKEM